MKPVVLALLLLAAPAGAATLSDLEGAWVVDLRPQFTDPAYTKPMNLKIAADRAVSGDFYNSEILDGRASANQGRLCVAFKTTDGAGLYQSSGCLIGDKIVGETWAEGRKFLLNWTATRAP